MSAYPADEPDVIDLGSRHFMRPYHDLVVRDEPPGTPVLARDDTPVKGLLVWHDCKAQQSSWHIVLPPVEVIECPIAGCGDRGRIVAGKWEAC